MVSPDRLTAESEASLAELLIDKYFGRDILTRSDSPDGERLVREHVRGRYDICRKWLIPWLQRLVDLRCMDVVEIGCGTGSTSAALALECGSVDGYDISESSVYVARRRAEIMALQNCRFHHDTPQKLVMTIAREHPAGTVGVVVCFAVLEHATHEERLDLLRLMWGMLAPGGLLVIGGTPSRLSYWDFHTSWTHFFNTLPHDIAIAYTQRSPRAVLRERILKAQSQSRDAAVNALVREGLGLSYHEFELALGDDFAQHVIADGFDPEPLSFFGVDTETRLLYSYARAKGLDIHPAFLRSTVEVILRKPGGSDPPSRPERNLDTIVRPVCLTEDWRVAAQGDPGPNIFRSTDGSDVMRVVCRAYLGAESWQWRLVSRFRAVRPDVDYTVSFRVRADEPRTMVFSLKEGRAPWAHLGLTVDVSLTTEWQELRWVFRVRKACPDAVYAFELGGSTVSVEIADIVMSSSEA